MTVRPLVATRLRCAHLENPLAVECDRVRFSWWLEGEGVGRRQSAYQLSVDRVHPEGHVTVWDSGCVPGEGTTDVAYGGAPLCEGASYRWRVRAWDENGAVGPWSECAIFETALAPDAWRGKFIGLGLGAGHFDVPAGDGLVDPVTLALAPAPYLRRAFELHGQVTRARLYVSALGTYDLSVNGNAVSDAVLAPGWTDYDQRLLYQAYDVTSLLEPGSNVIAAIVADGWACSFYGFDGRRRGAHYAQTPQLLAQLMVDRADGSSEVVASDETWRTSTGAVSHADLLMGERRNFRNEPVGWRLPDFDDSDWCPPRCYRHGTALIADPGPPVRPHECLPAVRVEVLADGTAIADFGQNLAGWVEIQTEHRTEPEIVVRHGEVCDASGRVYVENLRTARQVDSYALSGDGELLAPRFTFHGFRYAEITGLGADAARATITARVVHSDIPQTGRFECSSPMVTQLHGNIDWGQRSNFISVPTDCPQRDERLGWLGDAQVFVQTASYNRDVAAFFSKWMDDVVDAQLPNGAFSDFAPRLNHDWAGAPAWADAGVIVPWTMYKMYGDRALLERHYEAMAAWLAWLAASNPDRRWSRELGNNYGDWLAPVRDDTPRELLATAYFAYDAQLMARIAQALGREDDAAGYRILAAEVRDAFQRHYVRDDGQVESRTQTAYVLALHMDLVPDELRPMAASHLVEAIATEQWHLSTGFVGVGYLLPVLSENGYSDVAYRLLEQRSYPSWLYPIEHGATTVWERWDGWTEERGFQSPRMNSFNHYSLGSVGEWLYRFVLGIEQDAASSGFGRLILRPHAGGSLTFARGTFTSVRGDISSSWISEGGLFRLEISLPPNVTASVRVASPSPESVQGPGGCGPDRIDAFPGECGGKEAVFEVGSGRHLFRGPGRQAS